MMMISWEWRRGLSPDPQPPLTAGPYIGRWTPLEGPMTDLLLTREVEIPEAGLRLPGTLEVPADAMGLVIFAHGSGSSRLSPRNRAVAMALQESGLGTLLFDL